MVLGHHRLNLRPTPSYCELGESTMNRMKRSSNHFYVHHILWLCSSAISYVHNRPGHLLLRQHTLVPAPIESVFWVVILHAHGRMCCTSTTVCLAPAAGKKRYTCSCLLNDLTDMNMGRHLPCKRRSDDSSCRR